MMMTVKLIPYYPYEGALQWYLDKDVCRQVDKIDFVYDDQRLQRMYSYLNTHGTLFYIQCEDTLVGDCCLLDTGEIAIVIAKEYQNRHIGRNCIQQLINLAKSKKMHKIYANIYAFNKQSQKMFTSIGFQKIEDETYEYVL